MAVQLVEVRSIVFQLEIHLLEVENLIVLQEVAGQLLGQVFVIWLQVVMYLLVVDVVTQYLQIVGQYQEGSVTL